MGKQDKRNALVSHVTNSARMMNDKEDCREMCGLLNKGPARKKQKNG